MRPITSPSFSKSAFSSISALCHQHQFQNFEMQQSLYKK